ncbi:TetR/AcrR family transcriptional regulator [Paenibacillus alvei]|uniref:TetR/AcrR family transcriptional regulator n=1 Tax=Paenibacillus alvei TaxID=44250 RepID=UPI001F506420|nr:TetR/AcrR family transcriptional regulator [Paenibacillus alvei]
MATNIGKGSFYSYYNSKEELLYAIIKQNESRMFMRVESVLFEVKNMKEKILKALKEIYLAQTVFSFTCPPRISSICFASFRMKRQKGKH